MSHAGKGPYEALGQWLERHPEAGPAGPGPHRPVVTFVGKSYRPEILAAMRSAVLSGLVAGEREVAHREESGTGWSTVDGRPSTRPTRSNRLRALGDRFVPES